jgi:hypothetical protein
MAAPPAAYQPTGRRKGYASVPVVAAVVEMVRVAVPADAPVILTGVVEPKLNVGRFWAPAGLDVIETVSATLPVKPPDGVTETVEVFPVVAPRLTITPGPPTAKPAGTVTVTEPVPVDAP